jgi:hypothetical protein
MHSPYSTSDPATKPSGRDQPRDLADSSQTEGNRDVGRVAAEVDDTDADERQRPLQAGKGEGEDHQQDPEPRLDGQRPPRRPKTATSPVGAPVAARSGLRTPGVIGDPADEE